MDTRTRGFTLIELLVVVSIIGMISSIVLSSISGARDKASDARIKSNLRSIAVQAALYQSTNNSYGNPFTAATCPTSGATMFYADSSIRAAIAGAQQSGGGATRCASDGTNYAVSVELKTSTNHWCVDSRSASKEISNASWTGVTCP